MNLDYSIKTVEQLELFILDYMKTSPTKIEVLYLKYYNEFVADLLRNKVSYSEVALDPEENQQTITGKRVLTPMGVISLFPIKRIAAPPSDTTRVHFLQHKYQDLSPDDYARVFRLLANVLENNEVEYLDLKAVRKEILEVLDYLAIEMGANKCWVAINSSYLR